MTTTTAGTAPRVGRDDYLERNTLFGFPIPHRHLALLDFENNTVALYQSWRKVGNPEAYLRAYYGAAPDVPQGAA